MATGASAQRAPTGGGSLHRTLPFYSRFHTNGTAGVDIFSLNVSHMSASLRICFGYYFPQLSLVGDVLAHMSKCYARAANVGPNIRASRFPMLVGTKVRSVQIAFKGEDS